MTATMSKHEMLLTEGLSVYLRDYTRKVRPLGKHELFILTDDRPGAHETALLIGKDKDKGQFPKAYGVELVAHGNKAFVITFDHSLLEVTSSYEVARLLAPYLQVILGEREFACEH